MGKQLIVVDKWESAENGGSEDGCTSEGSRRAGASSENKDFLMLL